MIKKLLGCVREYKKHSILAPVLISFEVVMEVIIPILMANLIDYGIDKGDMPYVIKTGIMLVVAALISLMFGVLAGRSASIASCGFGKNLRHDMFHNLQNFAFSNIDKYSSASIVTRLTTDVNNIQNAFQMVIRMAVRSPSMLIFSLIMAFSINWKLALIFVAAVPFLLAGLLLIVTHAHPVFRRVFKTYDKLNRVVQENLRGIRVVKSFVREEEEMGKFGEISDDIYKSFSRAEKLVAFNMPLMQFCMYTCTLLVSWFGARMIVACGGNPEVMSTGLLMSLLTYSAQILSSLMMVSMAFVMFTISRASAERIVELLDEKSDIQNKENPVLEVKDGSISFKDVTFRYNNKSDKPCLDSVSVEIKSGETVGIIGATGSAKSSFVQLIPRLYDVSGGSVEVGGVDVRDYDIETLRNNVAMVLQKNVLFSGTIKENLRWGDENATDEEIAHAAKLACAAPFIEEFPDKYDTYIEQDGTNVSGGQKQRLCIARALLKKPKILILDDSTSAVDTKTDADIRAAFKNEIPNVTKLIIAQRIASVQEADKIIVLDDGKINGFGTHEELLANNEIYKEVYYSQVKGGDNE